VTATSVTTASTLTTFTETRLFEALCRIPCTAIGKSNLRSFGQCVWEEPGSNEVFCFEKDVVTGCPEQTHECVRCDGNCLHDFPGAAKPCWEDSTGTCHPARYGGTCTPGFQDCRGPSEQSTLTTVSTTTTTRPPTTKAACSTACERGIFGPCRDSVLTHVCSVPGENGQCGADLVDCRDYYNWPDTTSHKIPAPNPSCASDQCATYSINGLAYGMESSRDDGYCSTKCDVLFPEGLNQSEPHCQTVTSNRVICTLPDGLTGECQTDAHLCGPISFTRKSYGSCQDPTTGICLHGSTERGCALGTSPCSTPTPPGGQCTDCAKARGRQTSGVCKHLESKICTDFEEGTSRCFPGLVKC
jgi:hypothetical protein